MPGQTRGVIIACTVLLQFAPALGQVYRESETRDPPAISGGSQHFVDCDDGQNTHDPAGPFPA